MIWSEIRLALLGSARYRCSESGSENQRAFHYGRVFIRAGHLRSPEWVG